MTPSTWFRRPPKKLLGRVSAVQCLAPHLVVFAIDLTFREPLIQDFARCPRAWFAVVITFVNPNEADDEKEKHGQREQHEQSAKIQTPAPASPPIVHRLEVSI